MATPRLITRALQIVQTMKVDSRFDGVRRRVACRYIADRRYRELRQILTDLDAREGKPDPSKRAKYRLKPKRKK
jgi:hypothetical protein